MKLPGFTADASLYHGNAQYIASVESTGRERGLQPQSILWPPGIPGIDWCIWGCVCVSQIGCPCCNWIRLPSWPTTRLF
jgi:hypothetical protein